MKATIQFSILLLIVIIPFFCSADNNDKKNDKRQLQYNGQWEGSLKIATRNMTIRIGRNNDFGGYAWIAEESGVMDVCELEIASNKLGEVSKSCKNTPKNSYHPYPATWAFKFRLFELDSSMSITGSSLKDIKFIHTNIDGHPIDDGRVIYSFDLSGITVEKGKMYFFAIENLQPSPYEDHCSLNAYSNQRRPKCGSNQIDIFNGDYPILGIYRDGSFHQHREALNGLGIRMANGKEYGGLEMDATASAMRTNIGEKCKARSRWSKPYKRTVDAIALGVARTVENPNGNLTVKIFGEDDEIMSFEIKNNDIQHTDYKTFGTLTNQVFSLPSLLTLSKDVMYTVELSAPASSAGAYKIQGVRHATGNFSRAGRNTNIPQPADSIPFIEPHKSSGLGERSSDGGKSWQIAGWEHVDLPIALRVSSIE